MTLYRIAQSVANYHNILLLLIIITFVYVSFLPVRENGKKDVSSVDVVPTCAPSVVTLQECEKPDLSPYAELLSNFEQLKMEYESMRMGLDDRVNSKMSVLEKTVGQLEDMEQSVKSALTSLDRRQLAVASRMEKIQRRISVPRNITRIEKTVVEISGSCPLFQIESSSEYSSVQGTLEGTKRRIIELSEAYDSLVAQNLASQQWLQKLMTAVPTIKQHIAKLREKQNFETDPIDHNRIAVLVQNEVHDQWKATKASQETFAELYRISTETFDTITERWQGEIEQQRVSKPRQEAKKKERQVTASHTISPKQLSSSATAINSDETPSIDFALISTGATIVSSETSDTFIPTVSTVAANPGMLGFLSHKMSKTLLGGSPEDAISPAMVRGSCWPMQGTSGNLTVQLAHPVVVTAVTVDHLRLANIRLCRVPLLTLLICATVATLTSHQHQEHSMFSRDKLKLHLHRTGSKFSNL